MAFALLHRDAFPLLQNMLALMAVFIPVATASPAFGRTFKLADPNTVWVISKGAVAGDIA